MLTFFLRFCLVPLWYIFLSPHFTYFLYLFLVLENLVTLPDLEKWIHVRRCSMEPMNTFFFWSAEAIGSKSAPYVYFLFVWGPATLLLQQLDILGAQLLTWYKTPYLVKLIPSLMDLFLFGEILCICYCSSVYMGFLEEFYGSWLYVSIPHTHFIATLSISSVWKIFQLVLRFLFDSCCVIVTLVCPWEEVSSGSSYSSSWQHFSPK